MDVWMFLEKMEKRGWQVIVKGIFDYDDLDDNEVNVRHYKPEEVEGIIEKRPDNFVEAVYKSIVSGKFEPFYYDSAPVLSINWKVRVERLGDGGAAKEEM